MANPAFVIVPCVIALATLSGARAEIKNFTIRGTIEQVEGGLGNASITNGVSFAGYYIFDTTTSDSNEDPTVGDYWHTNSTFGLSLVIGELTFRSNPKTVRMLVEVVNRPERDNYVIRSYSNIGDENLFVQHLSWQLDGLPSALDSDRLPAAPPLLSDFAIFSRVTVDGGERFRLFGSVTSVEETPAVIPERPATEVKDAIEVTWQSKLGYFYQIESAANGLENWEKVGDVIMGTGKTMSRYFPRVAVQNVLYRVEIANHPW